jgi:peptidyl-Lys metalloendopeptidase
MPLVLENFLQGDHERSLKEHLAKDAYSRLSTILSSAHVALIRIANDSKEQERFLKWFGQYNPENKQLVYNKIHAIHNAVVNRNITFRNGGPECRIGDFAYVQLNTGLAKVFLCDSFFRAGRTGIDSTVGTIIHELSHLIANTQDHVYQQIRCRGLATTNPSLARSNADNYEYYCESFG